MDGVAAIWRGTITNAGFGKFCPSSGPGTSTELKALIAYGPR